MKIQFKLLSVTTSLFLAPVCLGASVALIDFQLEATSGGGHNATATNATLADFSNSGVVESLTGGMIDYYGASAITYISSYATGNATVSFVDGTPSSGDPYKGAFNWSTVTNNPTTGDREQLSVMARDGLFMSTDNYSDAAVTVSNITINPGQIYKLYLWGTNDRLDNGSTSNFTFDGSTVGSNTGTSADVPVVFTFDSTAAGVTANSVTFNWASPTPGSGMGAPLNAIAITAVPEPTTTALLGLGGLALIFRRRP